MVLKGLIVGIGKKSYGFMNFRTLKKLYNTFPLKTPGMHFYCCNDAVPWLNEAKSRIFRCTVIVKNFQIHLYFDCHLPPAWHKTRFRYVCGSNFSHKECNWHLQYESVVPKKICPLCSDDSLHPSLAFIVLL